MSQHYNCDGIRCDGSCQEEPAEFIARDAADFASLLEREPQPEKVLGSPTTTDWCGHCGRGWSVTAKALANANATTESQRLRIKSLEDVLVAIRAKASHPVSYYEQAKKHLGEISALVSETLDPCKPWCDLGEGHGGACMSADEAYDGE